MMKEELFNNWKFIYDNSKDISLHFAYYQEGRNDPSLVVDILPEDFKAIVGEDHAYHIDVTGSFDLTIHAIVDNEVYVTLLMRTSEYGWKKYDQFVLNKKAPSRVSKLDYFSKPYGFYQISIKESN